ncbi:MAG: hypothetical protein AAF518_01330 [Spirochaetota bacterium]
MQMKRYMNLVWVCLFSLLWQCKSAQLQKATELGKEQAAAELQAELDKGKEKLENEKSKTTDTAKAERDAKRAELASRALENTIISPAKADSTDTSKTTTKVADEITPPKIEKKQQKNWGYEGWGGRPDLLSSGGNPGDATDKNWYYKTVTAEASQRARELKSPSYIEFTCKNTARKDKSSKLLDSLYASVVDNPADLERNQKIKDVLVKAKPNVKVASCRSLANDVVFSKCECTLYLEYQGGKENIKKKVAEISQ